MARSPRQSPKSPAKPDQQVEPVLATGSLALAPASHEDSEVGSRAALAKRVAEIAASLPIAGTTPPGSPPRSGPDAGLRIAAPSSAARPPADPPDPAMDLEWQRQFFRERRLESARIPRRFWKKTLENFETRIPGTNRVDPLRRSLVEIARDFVRRFGSGAEGDYPKGLLFTGITGCGKSHLASAILRAVVLEGHTGLYYNSPDLLMDIRSTFEADSRIHESELLDMVDEVDLLVLDDLGAEKVTDFVLDRFYLVVNRRYEGCKPILVTSNHAPDELAARLGERVVSRLFEMCTPISDFPREDFRRRTAQSMM